jgi:hypothetical protein
MATLAEIRAKLHQSTQQTILSGDNQIFPHWNIQEGTTTTVRFIPDGDPNNTFFWIERAMIKLPFAGIKDENNSKLMQVQVPCMEMWNESCPVLTEVRPWFKDKNFEDMGRKYWKKKSYLFQGFVVDTKLVEDKIPDNPIRRFIIGSQIFNIVKNALMDSEIEELPTDYVRGLDFKIVKTTKGGYADYSTSNWARRERALSELEQSAIKQHGLYKLSDFLPKKPGEVELKIIKEMFEASVAGHAFDMDRWGQYFKPVGINGSTTSSSNNSSAAKAQSAVKQIQIDDDAPFETNVSKAQLKVQESDASSSSDSSSRAADIIAMIRKRNQQ